MKIRIKFSKKGELRYIGHLDVMRYFQKAFRRANFDIAYSNGFNPHQIMSFSAPLGLGMTSEAEYLDAELISSDSSAEMIRRLSAVVGDGFEIKTFRKIPDDKKHNAMASLKFASYKLYLNSEYSDKLKAIDNELANEYKLEISDDYATLFLPAGSEKNIKPIVALKEILSDMQLDDDIELKFKTGEFMIERLEQYTIENGVLMRLCDIGEEI